MNKNEIIYKSFFDNTKRSNKIKLWVVKKFGSFNGSIDSQSIFGKFDVFYFNGIGYSFPYSNGRGY